MRSIPWVMAFSFACHCCHRTRRTAKSSAGIRVSSRFSTSSSTRLRVGTWAAFTLQAEQQLVEQWLMPLQASCLLLQTADGPLLMTHAALSQCHIACGHSAAVP